MEEVSGRTSLNSHNGRMETDEKEEINKHTEQGELD
jgi:hypothetical protein